MCCFSPVTPSHGFLARILGRSPRLHVAHTNIFARKLDTARQLLVYSMDLDANGELAMLLPIPVDPTAGERGVEFVNLESHPNFFRSLESLFVPPNASRSRSPSQGASLAVHTVGAFEASFVPTPKEFARLDVRFRLPEGIWQQLGEYHDWGFAVFRLAPGGKKTIHPMAFTFRTRDPLRLFFPTVHVHDGRVHTTATFDHALYYQGDTDEHDERSVRALTPETLPHVDPLAPVFLRRLRGSLPNRDTWVPLTPQIERTAS